MSNIVATIMQSIAGGSIIGPGAPSVTIGGVPVSLDGDAVSSHGGGLHSAPTVVATNNQTITIGNKKIIVNGDPATCGHNVIAIGTVSIG